MDSSLLVWAYLRSCLPWAQVHSLRCIVTPRAGKDRLETVSRRPCSGSDCGSVPGRRLPWCVGDTGPAINSNFRNVKQLVLSSLILILAVTVSETGSRQGEDQLLFELQIALENLCVHRHPVYASHVYVPTLYMVILETMLVCRDYARYCCDIVTLRHL